ncbi:flagellar basal body-associated FliL family protein [Massilia pseudoviolaceinigra]|uniref:flagellar basal body-associated FliL family protein n=1 Tax=Massilia pseudoviolaceinigra TaxID=3057165 RepID=UPI0027968B98|nr:flagellar basal body-associated FliL family protein [Massilia sp. CCM 9206]MDQ1924912.1 flagellar basal body-associated FliL family protein [Massilia sp. CCM 9206]
MKKTTKLIIAFVVIGIVGAAGAGAALYFKQPMPGKDGKPAEAEAPKKKPARYVSLDKVIVMLRRSPGETQAHYISTDLVLSTTLEQEKKVKDDLPMLRSVAVRALSAHTMGAAQALTVEQYAEQINSTFAATYDKDKLEKPFSEVMIGKLIIE